MSRWNLLIPDSTDRAVRMLLARSGDKKEDLSHFVDTAVRQRVIDLTLAAIKARNGEHEQQEILDVIDREVAATRADRSIGKV